MSENNKIKNERIKLNSDNIFNKADNTTVKIDKKYASFSTILYYIYNKRLSDINIDVYEDTDCMLITGRRGTDYHKFFLIKKKEENEYTDEEIKMINHYKNLAEKYNNLKVYYISYSPYDLLSDILEGLVLKYSNYLKYTKDIEKKTFYEYLVDNKLNDSAIYVISGIISSGKEYKEVSMNKNNRTNIAISNIKIAEGLIKKSLNLVMRPNYTDLKFDDVRESMLTLYKIERYIFDFLTGGWKKLLEEENPEEYHNMIAIGAESIRNKGKEITNNFFSMLQKLGFTYNETLLDLIDKASDENISKEEKEEIFKEIDIFGKELKGKDNIDKFFTALESGSGLMLITGPTGSGKTTYLMTGLQNLVNEKVRTLLTLEDPVEFMIQNDLGLVYQKEVNKEVKDYTFGVKDALREKPDIIVLGEIREDNKENLAKRLIETAKTGHLILGTMHATNLYDGYNRFKKLAETEETFLTYMINLRRLQLRTGDYINVYSHYNYDKTKDSATSEKEMMEVDKSFVGINRKLLIMFLLGLIDIETLNDKCSDPSFISKELNKLKTSQYINSMFSKETYIKIDRLAGSTD